MGMYTEIYVNVDLIRDVSEDVLNILKAIVGEQGYCEHLEGLPSRWGYLFNNGSYYTPNTSVKKLTYDTISGQWSLLGKGDLKNYDNEIQEFFEWIMPYVDGEGFMGYYRFEEIVEPVLVFKGDKL